VEGRLKKKKLENYYLDEDSWSSGIKKVLLACGALFCSWRSPSSGYFG
jgi:hypothetical protein